MMLKKIKEYFSHKSLKSKGLTLVKPYYIESFERISFNGVCYIGPHFYCSAKGGLSIGENVIIGPKCNIWTYNHDFKSNQMIPYSHGDVFKPVVIGDHVWIGLNVTILPGTKINRGAIVSAGSVVRGEIEECAIVAGNPATIVGYRNKYSFYDNVKRKNHYLRLK
ncbi:TPA: acyltransferase [Vibrio vulnificus]|nr:acyltransferase [Vibrio vulnificus]